MKMERMVEGFECLNLKVSLKIFKANRKFQCCWRPPSSSSFCPYVFPHHRGGWRPVGYTAIYQQASLCIRYSSSTLGTFWRERERWKVLKWIPVPQSRWHSLFHFRTSRQTTPRRLIRFRCPLCWFRLARQQQQQQQVPTFCFNRKVNNSSTTSLPSMTLED
jgi:hypothetical protein